MNSKQVEDWLREQAAAELMKSDRVVRAIKDDVITPDKLITLVREGLDIPHTDMRGLSRIKRAVTHVTKSIGKKG